MENPFSPLKAKAKAKKYCQCADGHEFFDFYLIYIFSFELDLVSNVTRMIFDVFIIGV